MEACRGELRGKGYVSFADTIDSYLKGGFGSGFVYAAEDGTKYVITNLHVMMEADKTSITFENQDENSETRNGLKTFAVNESLDFALLAVLVVLLPACIVDVTGLGEPWFCKYVCPVGTFEGGIPLVLLNSAMRGAAGFLFRWKLMILAVTLFASVIVYRPFCRYVCPLGAIYGMFNKVSLYQVHVESSKCVSCGACQKACKMDIPVWQNAASMDCIRCGECAHGAIRCGFRAEKKE